MPPSSFQPLVSGRPVFAGATDAGPAATPTPLAAWRKALAGGAMTGLRDTQGSFALTLQTADNATLLATDRFAIEPLCWRIADGQLHAAHRADALADGADIDPQALFDYLYFHVIPSPRTIFKGVHRLPAAHSATFKAGQIDVAPYWVPRFTPQRSGVNFEALKTEFRDLLRQATAAQLDGGKPGCFLSGGTDSSTIAGMLSQATGGRAASYSIGFEAEGYDEMAYARLAAKHFGTEHHEYYVTPEDLVRSIPEVAAHYDQPFGNSSAVPAFYCARMARDNGVTRILAGDGGDEFFGGNSRYATQRVFGAYDQVPGPLRTLLEPLFGSALASGLPLLRKGSSYIRQAKVGMPARLQNYNLLQLLGVQDVLMPGFLSQVDTGGPLLQQREVWAMAHADTALDRNLAFDWRYTLAENDLPKVCGTTALAGLEVGFPFLDQSLVDFSMRLPTHYKLRGLKLRWFFKEALRGFLPDAIITKKKHGFGLPFGVWAVRHQALNKLARDSLGSLSTRGIVRPAFINNLLENHLPQHPGYYGEMVWILMMLEQWLQRHRPDYRLAA